MDTLLSWIKDIIVLSVAIFIVKSILPNSGVKKYAEMALSVVMIAVILSPLRNLGLEEMFESVNASFENYTAVSTASAFSLEDRASSLASERLRVLLGTNLASAGFKDCEVNIHVTAEGELKYVEISGELDEVMKAKVAKITTETLGIDESYLIFQRR